MTALIVCSVVLLFFLVPFLTGNIYGAVFAKQKLGVVSTYLAGVATIYAFLTVMQFVVIKFKFDFLKVSEIYQILFAVCVSLGLLCFLWRVFKDKSIRWDVIWNKKKLWILGIILLQGVLYIVFKNPYFENNALFETTRVTMETGTVYEYNAYTGQKAVAGFPLSNKLMFLPMFYAYVCTTFGIDGSILFNYILPIVTFVSFYALMILWIQKLGKEYGIKWEMLVLLLVWIVQVGDGWKESVAFRILHSGYMGEAIFFGVLLPFAAYMFKNRCYLIGMVAVTTFPGLVKYDAVVDFVKGFQKYWEDGAKSSGMLIIYVLAVVFFLWKYRKWSWHLLSLNLTIMFSISLLWDERVSKVENKRKKWITAGVFLLVIMMCGNIRLISDATMWRSNVYGVPEAEYEVLKHLDEENSGEEIRVVACDDLVKWIKRAGFSMTPVIGYDLGGTEIGWYSYETYDENYQKFWKNVNYAMSDMEEQLMIFTDEIDTDYILVKRITTEIPIQDNEEIKCVYDTPAYLVYSVDKK